jgi:16S rRNA C967 or C1407 C5-methylase (RsmB/RsmF family)
VVYATCSSEPEENDAVVEALLRERSDFERLDLSVHASRVVTPFIDAFGQFRTLPPAHGLEAFFAAVMVRT